MTIDKIIKEVALCNKAYAGGNPYMTDEEYDQLWAQLRNYDSTHPLLYNTSYCAQTGNDYIIHSTPIYGTQKAFNMEDLKPFLLRYANESLIIEPKYDGIAAMIYKSENGVELVLSGDGIKGQDKTEFLSDTVYESLIGYRQSVELIIAMEDWEPSMGSNPRNTIAGWINRGTPNKDMKFHIVRHDGGSLVRGLRIPYNPEDLQQILLECYHEWKQIYPMDGIMIKLADRKKRLTSGHNGTVYNWSIAWKPPISTATTKVKDIHWKVSRLGRVVPTVEYEPINLCGTMNKFATGNNAKWIENKSITLGVPITVGKAGEIIPQIIDVDSSEVMGVYLPDTCPECGADLQWNGIHLICNDDNCIAQVVKRTAYFYSDKGMTIKSIGEQMIYELFDHPLLNIVLKRHIWKLLDPYTLLPSIVEVWGEKRTNTYVENLNSLQKTKNRANYIASLGYPNLAYKKALKCYQSMLGYPTRGSSIKNSVVDFTLGLADLRDAEDNGLNFEFSTIPRTPDVIYCITGTLSNSRADVISYLETYNWQFTNQVSKNVDYLLLGELENSTTKSRKAKELGVSIITEEQLPKHLNKKEI